MSGSCGVSAPRAASYTHNYTGYGAGLCSRLLGFGKKIKTTFAHKRGQTDVYSIRINHNQHTLYLRTFGLGCTQGTHHQRQWVQPAEQRRENHITEEVGVSFSALRPLPAFRAYAKDTVVALHVSVAPNSDCFANFIVSVPSKRDCFAFS